MSLRPKTLRDANPGRDLRSLRLVLSDVAFLQLYSLGFTDATDVDVKMAVSRLQSWSARIAAALRSRASNQPERDDSLSGPNDVKEVEEA